MHLIDSSIWVALFLPQDSTNVQANKLFEKLEGRIAVLHCAISETVTVLVNKGGKKAADEFLHYIEQSSDLEILWCAPKDEMKFFLDFPKPLSYVDVAEIDCASTGRYELLSFDKELLRESKRYQKKH